MPIKIRNAYYIKLGEGGCWEADSISNGRLRFEWKRQTTEDINARDWPKIGRQLMEANPGNPGVATADLNALRRIVESTPDDMWITFHLAKLWWTRLAEGAVEEDLTSKFRNTTEGGWSDRAANGRLLVVNELPGKIAKLQGFRNTVCAVDAQDHLARLLAGEVSPLAHDITEASGKLSTLLQAAITDLHWKDYETLVDLVFLHSGWERISVLGQQAKAYDLELRESLTNDRYVVQVKSRASRADLMETAEQFSSDDYRRIFFVVHSPTADLQACRDIPKHVEIVPPAKLAELALEAGLTGWIRSKIS